MASHGRQIPGLEDCIIQNEHRKGFPDYKTPQQIAEQMGTTIRYVYKKRSDLILQGRLPGKFPNSKLSHDISKVPELVSDDPDKVVGSLDRIRVLSRLIRTGSPHIKISAIKAMEELTRTTEKRIGPPNPASEEETLARISRILLAAGEELSKKAYVTVFGSEPPLS